VPVGAGEESRVSIQLLRLPTVRVSGKINGWKPDFNATASLSEIATGDSFSGGIDGKTGEFTFTGVHFGRYEMNVTANQSPLRTNDDAELEFGPVLVGHAVLEVQQQNTMVNIVLAPAPADREINGTLSTETKAPLPLSTVTIALLDPADLLDLSVSTFVARAAVDEKGAFSAEVRGGRKAFVGVESREDAWSNWYVKNVLLDGRDISESGIASTDPGGKLQVILSDGGGIVEGVALDRDSHPVPDAYVMMFPDGKPARFDVWQYGKADANGSFTLRGIPPMSYVVAAWETEPNRDDLRDPAFVNRALQTGSKVTVASRTAKKVEVLAQPPAEIP
jgi:hypothetical protein